MVWRRLRSRALGPGGGTRLLQLAVVQAQMGRAEAREHPGMQTRGAAPAGLRSPRSSTQLRGQLCPSPVPSFHAWENLILQDCPASTPTRGPPPSHHLRASGHLQAGQELWTSDGRAVHRLSARPHAWCDPGKSLCVLGCFCLSHPSARASGRAPITSNSFLPALPASGLTSPPCLLDPRLPVSAHTVTRRPPGPALAG